jgi:hypothetical protein
VAPLETPDAAGAGAAVATAGWAVGSRTGVIVTPLTFPVIAAFWTEPFVPRAARVAFALALAAARAAVVKGVGGLRGLREKAWSVLSALLNISATVSRISRAISPFAASST